MGVTRAELVTEGTGLCWTSSFSSLQSHGATGGDEERSSVGGSARRPLWRCAIHPPIRSQGSCCRCQPRRAVADCRGVLVPRMGLLSVPLCERAGPSCQDACSVPPSFALAALVACFAPASSWSSRSSSFLCTSPSPLPCARILCGTPGVRLFRLTPMLFRRDGRVSFSSKPRFLLHCLCARGDVGARRVADAEGVLFAPDRGGRRRNPAGVGLFARGDTAFRQGEGEHCCQQPAARLPAGLNMGRCRPEGGELRRQARRCTQPITTHQSAPCRAGQHGRTGRRGARLRVRHALDGRRHDCWQRAR